MLVKAKKVVAIIVNKDRFEIQGEALDGEFEFKGTVHPKMKICWKCTHPQAIQD